jgi:hypothetical protein
MRQFETTQTPASVAENYAVSPEEPGMSLSKGTAENVRAVQISKYTRLGVQVIR